MEFEEQIPKLVPVQNDCYQYKINYIHSPLDFKDFVDSFIPHIKDDKLQAFKLTSTFIFDRIGYGAFVYVKNGKIHTFQAFANIYGDKTNVLEFNDNPEEFYLKKIANLNIKKNKFLHRIIKERKHWLISGCFILHWEDWWKTYDAYINIYYDMLSKTRDGDMNACFFINLLDEPLLGHDECIKFLAATPHTYLGEDLTHYFIPVLSGCTTAHHLDKIIVYADAWEIVSQHKFGTYCKESYYHISEGLVRDWDIKIPKIMFRGTNTSCYPNDFEKNIRLKSCNVMNEIIAEHNSDITIDIDVGIVGVTTQTFYTDKKLVASEPKKIKSKLKFKEKIPMPEQSICKYILNMDGFVTAWRLCFELSYNSCIILIRSKYISWFYDQLHHGENVYMIDDTSDLKKEFKKALIHFSKNDDNGRYIAEGAVALYNKIMNVDYISKYMHTLISDKSFNIMNPVITPALVKSVDYKKSKVIKKTPTKKKSKKTTKTQTIKRVK